MISILKISKIITYSLLVIFLLSSSIQLFFPDAYASYKTGYSVDSIIGHRTGNSDRSLLCKEFFPEKVSQAMGGIWIFSLLTFVASFIFILIFKLLLIKKEYPLFQSKNIIDKFFVVLIILFLIFYIVLFNQGEIVALCIIMFICFYLLFAIIKLSLTRKKIILFQSKHTMRNFIIIFLLSFLMLFNAFLDEYTYDYTVGCEQLQKGCERIQADSEEFGRESVEEYHARGEYLYCD